MARKCLVIKSQRKPKFMTRKRSRCKLCGRPRGYFSKFQVCRICFRNMASTGRIPGVRKASW